jgi:hypothetical protein
VHLAHRAIGQGQQPLFEWIAECSGGTWPRTHHRLVTGSLTTALTDACRPGAKTHLGPALDS